MNSRESLEKLLKENEKARDSFQRIGGLPEEEARKALENFEKEFGIELRKEDFTGQELDSEQLESITGGVDPVSLVGTIVSVYGLIDKPGSTRRGTTGGTRRYN